MPDVIPALVGREEIERERDKRQHVVEAPWSRRAEEGLQLGKRLFDRIEIWTVRRQKPDRRPDGFDGAADLGLFVHREVVEDDDIAAPERRDEHLVHVGVKRHRVDRAVKHGWRGEALDP